MRRVVWHSRPTPGALATANGKPPLSIRFVSRCCGAISHHGAFHFRARFVVWFRLISLQLVSRIAHCKSLAANGSLNSQRPGATAAQIMQLVAGQGARLPLRLRRRGNRSGAFFASSDRNASSELVRVDWRRGGLVPGCCNCVLCGPTRQRRSQRRAVVSASNMLNDLKYSIRVRRSRRVHRNCRSDSGSALARTLRSSVSERGSASAYCRIRNRIV